MKLYGLFTILYTVFYVFDVCDSKCEEYVIVFQELSCGNSYNLKPVKIDEISWNHLTYPYNTTEVYKEVQGYKECILEFDCKGQVASCFDKIVTTNHSIDHSIDSPRLNTEKPEKNIDEIAKPNKKVSPELDNEMVDLTITYIIKKDHQNSSDVTKKENIIQCDRAEIICTNEKQLENNNLTNEENGIEHTHHHGTTTLVVTIQRDPSTTTQPIYTGYFPQSLKNLNTTEINFKEFKIVTFTCAVLEENYCKSKMHINVYLKTNYIQNNVTTKYPNCTKDITITNGSINLNCDAKNFAHNNQQIQLPPRVINEAIIKSNNETNHEVFLMGVKDLLISKCQITTDLNNIEVHINDSNVLSFRNCSNYLNMKNETKSRDLNMTLLDDSKDQIIDNINTTTELNKTEHSILNTEINKDYLSSINKDNIITLRITENGNNCSHSSPFSIHAGKIIDLEAIDSKKQILEYSNVVLNISKCIKINSSETQIELAIVLKDGSLNTSELFDENPAEVNVKQKAILQCGRPNFNSNSNDANRTILQCESIYLEDFHNITEVNNTIKKEDTSNATEIAKKIVCTDCTDKYSNETKINIGEPEKNNGTLNETVAPKYTNDNSTKDDPNKEIGNDTLSKGNSDINFIFNRKKDMAKGLGQSSLSLESNEPEKIMIITLCSLAGAFTLVIFTIKKCGKKATYHPTPTREAPDEEDTAL